MAHITGKLGKELTIEDGYQAAWLTGVNHIATLKSELGNLNKVKRIVKVLGMVNSTQNFVTSRSYKWFFRLNG